MVGTTASVAWVTQYPRPVEAGQNDDLAKGMNKAGTGVFCLGLVDVEGGLIQLGPLQPGEIVQPRSNTGPHLTTHAATTAMRDKDWVGGTTPLFER